MYRIADLKMLLPFDIEVIPEKTWNELAAGKKKLWLEKYHFRHLSSEIEFRKKQYAIEHGSASLPSEGAIETPTIEEIYIKYCPVYAEFGRVWCISVGVFAGLKNEINVDTIYDEDEKQMLTDFVTTLKHYENHNLAGYAIADFDIPYVLKRMWVHGITADYPRQLQLKDAKPWTVKHVDFMYDWKSLTRESVSLGVVCETLNVPTPKDKFDNHEFTTLLTAGKITTKDGIEYCEKDVVALMKCMLKVASESSNYDGGETVKSSGKSWGKK
jgi:3'-5' exonuclease